MAKKKKKSQKQSPSKIAKGNQRPVQSVNPSSAAGNSADVALSRLIGGN